MPKRTLAIAAVLALFVGLLAAATAGAVPPEKQPNARDRIAALEEQVEELQAHVDDHSGEIGMCATADHSHAGYAPVAHAHSGYAPLDHLHGEYALVMHTHAECWSCHPDSHP